MSMLHQLLTQRPGAVRLDPADPAGVRSAMHRLPGGDPITRAALGGLVADRLGVAFLAGYRAALDALLGQGQAQALAVTEAGGNHPRAIETTIEEDGDALLLDGVKVWCTGADTVDTLVVVGRMGESGGRPTLRAVLVPADIARLRPMPPTPFVPEIGHCQIHLERCRVPRSALLPGDGWTDVVKPFRTVEDIHVLAAVTGHGVGLARQAEAAALVEEGLAQLAALAHLATQPALAPSTHIALAGVLQRLVRWFDAARAQAPEARRADLERDRPLLSVATGARTKRTERAWAAVGRRV